MLSPQSRAVNVTVVDIRMSVHLLLFFVCESNGLNIFCFIFVPVCYMYTCLCCNTHSLLSIVLVLGSADLSVSFLPILMRIALEISKSLIVLIGP